MLKVNQWTGMMRWFSLLNSVSLTWLTAGPGYKVPFDACFIIFDTCLLEGPNPWHLKHLPRHFTRNPDESPSTKAVSVVLMTRPRQPGHYPFAQAGNLHVSQLPFTLCAVRFCYHVPVPRRYASAEPLPRAIYDCYKSVHYWCDGDRLPEAPSTPLYHIALQSCNPNHASQSPPRHCVWGLPVWLSSKCLSWLTCNQKTLETLHRTQPESFWLASIWSLSLNPAFRWEQNDTFQSFNSNVQQPSFKGITGVYISPAFTHFNFQLQFLLN